MWSKTYGPRSRVDGGKFHNNCIESPTCVVLLTLVKYNSCFPVSIHESPKDVRVSKSGAFDSIALGHEKSRLIPLGIFVRSRRQHSTAVMLGHIGIGRIKLRLVFAGFADTALEIVRYLN